MFCFKTPKESTDEDIDISKLEEIGRGSQGLVYKLDESSVLKVFKPETDGSDKLAQKGELLGGSSLYRTKPKKVICIDPDKNNCKQLGLILERIEGCDLDKFIKKQGLGIDQIALIVCQLAFQLNVLHSANVIHRDIKLNNIIASSSEGFIAVCLIDHSLAFKLKGKKNNDYISPLSERYGTKGFKAPEVVKSGGVGKKSDIYSLGVVFSHLFFGIKSQDLSKDGLINADLVSDPVFTEGMDKFKDIIKKFVCLMLSKDHSKRPDTEEVLMFCRFLFNSISLQKPDTTYYGLENKQKQSLEKLINGINLASHDFLPQKASAKESEIPSSQIKAISTASSLREMQPCNIL